MKYNPEIHHRRSIRLQGYDYSQSGAYFITLCCQNREHLLGEIHDGEMVLNDAGKMVKKWFYELENKFADIKCDEMIVMPNHIHFIVENTAVKTVGADLRVCPCCETSPNTDETPVDEGETPPNTGEHIGSPQRIGSSQRIGSPQRFDGNTGETPVEGETPVNTGETSPNTGETPVNTGEHVGSPLRSVVQWLKTMTTNEYIRGVKNYGWRRFNGKLWQRNYYEHIIRDEKSLENIRNYIINNPAKWAEDENNLLRKVKNARQ